MKHVAILIPGLSDGEGGLAFATRNWERKHGILPIVMPMQWRSTEERYEEKLKRAVGQIDVYYKKGYKVALIGTSAGGSAAINAFFKRKNKISKVVNVCGRLRKGERVYPSLNIAAKTSPAFKKSVLECEKNLSSLNREDATKILTIRPLFDEIVPTSLVSVQGATNIQIISVGHVVSITLAMTIYSNYITDFLLE